MSRTEHFVYSEENYKILEDLNVMHGLESSEDPEDPEDLHFRGVSQSTEKFFDLREKINDIINIKSYKI